MKENIIVDPPSEIVITSDRMVEVDLDEAKTTEAEDTAADEQEAAATPPEQDGEDEDTPEAETPQKPTATPSAPSMEERMLEMLLREKHPDTLATALADGKTIRGAWNYVVSVMKNAYITAHGKVSGGMCGSPDVVVEIAERYLREFPEGYTEPEAAHTPKKPTKTDGKADGKADAAAKVVKTVKKAAASAKEEAKRKHDEIMEKWKKQQLSFNF